jgi:uncharacterized protein YqhQ
MLGILEFLPWSNREMSSIHHTMLILSFFINSLVTRDCASTFRCIQKLQKALSRVTFWLSVYQLGSCVMNFLRFCIDSFYKSLLFHFSSKSFCQKFRSCWICLMLFISYFWLGRSFWRILDGVSQLLKIYCTSVFCKILADVYGI